MASTVQVKGLAELERFLDQLAPKLQNNVARGGLRAGAAVIAEEAKANCPEGPASTRGMERYGDYPGALRDSIRTGSRMQSGRPVGYVKAGGKVKGASAFYAHIVEYGAAAHGIGRKYGGLKAVAFGGMVRNSVWHPGMQPKPFLRPAFDAKAQEAVIAVGNYIKARLESNSLDVADIDIEGEKES